MKNMFTYTNVHNYHDNLAQKCLAFIDIYI